MYYFWLGVLAALIFQEVTDWKYTKQFFIFTGLYALLVLSVSCSQEEISLSPCLSGDCNAIYTIDPLVSPGATLGADGYWRIRYNGLKYFTIEGNLDILQDKYVINKVPLVETKYDSNYWIAFDKISFRTPYYTYLGWFTGGGFNNPIPVGEISYTLTDIAKIQPPLNIVGYQIQKNFCWGCKYAETLIGTYSKYTYNPRKAVYLNSRMIGDTINVFIKTIWNTDVGEREEKEYELKIIVE